MAQATPLERYRVLATSHLDEARDKVARYFWPHRIEFEGRRRDLAAAFHHAPIAETSLNYVRYGADTHIDAGEQPDCFMFKYAASGPLEAIRPDRTYAIGQGQLVASGPHCRLRVRFARNTGLLIFKVSRQRLERHLSDMLGDRPAGRLDFRDGPIAGSGTMASYLRALHLLRLELDTSDSLARCPAAAVEYEEFLMSALLRAWPHSGSRRLETPAAVAPGHVRRVVDYIEAHADRPLTSGDLVRVSGAGASTVYEAFRRSFGCSPLVHVRHVRLQRVRRDLLRPEPEDTVTSLALKWGFSHFGRFSGYYREAFGETPSETLRRGRQRG